MTEKKFIYILNSYSKNESSHFFHILGLLEALAERGIKIILIIEKAKDIPTFNTPNIIVTALKHQSGIRRYVNIFCLLRKYISQGYEKTYIRITTPTALVAAIAHKIYGGKSYLWLSGTTLEFDRNQPLSIKKIKWRLTVDLSYKLATKYISYLVTGPESMVDYYATVGGVEKKKIKLLYNDINLKRFELDPLVKIKIRQDAREKYEIPGNSTILLLVHRLSPVRKTMLYFPKCMEFLKNAGKLENLYVIVAGAGPELAAIQEQARNFNITHSCRFLGNVPNKDIQDLYAAADIFIHPTYNEGFPRVVIEAMAAGLPIVTTDAGGTRELLGTRQQQMVSEKDDTELFFNNLKTLAENPDLRNLLAKENQIHVVRYSTPNVAKMYDETIFDE